MGSDAIDGQPKRRLNIGSTLGLLVALYGAVLSTVLAVQQFSADQKDLDVQTYAWGSAGCPELAMAVVQVVNTGKRPLTVTSVDLETRRGTDVRAIESRHVLINGRVRVRPVPRPTRLPRRLENGEVMELAYPAAAIMSQLDQGVLKAELHGPEFSIPDVFFESFEWLEQSGVERDRSGCGPAFYGL